MGVIYTAHDTLTKREVAYKRLKIANEATRPRLTALFEREYNALRQLKHPNIVEVYDYGHDAEGPFYTMELLPGKDLAAVAPLPLAEACRVLRDVASALALLHARRLVHRDVTPANVRLARDGRAKLLDFGGLTGFGVAKEIVGTPSFIAPESLAGEALDGRADLFALGGLAYWTFTRRHAHPARTIAEAMKAWELPVTPPSEHVAGLPKEIDELVLSLLERDALARPVSAAHAIERLTSIGKLVPEQDEAQVAYGYLLHPPLVGRDELLDQLRACSAEAAQGSGRALLLEAAAGLGRSALLDRLAVEAQIAGSNVLRYQPSGNREAGLAQSIAQWMRSTFPQLWRAQLPRHPVLARETRAPLSAVDTPAQVTERRTRMIAAIHDCIDAMSRVTPLTLLVDDVQRADVETLALLASLARSTAASRVLLVMTQEERSRGADVNALGDMRRVCTTLALRPLSAADLEAMLTMVFGNVPNTHILTRFLHAQSAGNPGQCMDLCRLLLHEKQIRYEQGTFVLPFDPRSDPVSARALELTRLTGLSPRAHGLMQLLSLYEGALGFANALHALDCEEEELSSAVEELSGRALIVRSEGQFAVPSASLRNAVRGALSSTELCTLHAALAQTIVAHGDGSFETKISACHHLLCAGQEDEAVELIWTQLRTTSVPNGSVGVAVPVLERLLAVMRKRGHPDIYLWPLLCPLVIGGFWGELGVGNRHRDQALEALSTLVGARLANRLSRVLGKKLSVVVGILSGVLRFYTMPKRFRPPTYRFGLQRFVTTVRIATATAAAAFEPAMALRVAALLDPFAALKEENLARCAREFSLATAELSAGRTAQAAERYGRLIHLLESKQLFDADIRNGLLDGAVHGAGQAVVSSGLPEGLAMAEQLEKRHPFFRPHAETIRMTYYGYRGDKQLAETHRKKAELLALQGGLSWSAFTTLTFRTAYIAMTSQDTMGVLQAMVELERLSGIAPNLSVIRDLCQAYVLLARGEAQEALAIYERCAAAPDADVRPAFELFAALHAEALTRLGRVEEAKALCEATIAKRRACNVPTYALRLLLQQLALIEAKLGNFARAKELLVDVRASLVPTQSALALGSVARDLARVALLERDAAAFDAHFEAMLSSFRSTLNPVLIQQCRRLLAEAEKSGLLPTPGWEKHELLAPANTQDLHSEVPEHTELVDEQSGAVTQEGAVRREASS